VRDREIERDRERQEECTYMHRYSAMCAQMYIFYMYMNSRSLFVIHCQTGLGTMRTENTIRVVCVHAQTRGDLSNNIYERVILHTCARASAYACMYACSHAVCTCVYTIATAPAAAPAAASDSNTCTLVLRFMRAQSFAAFASLRLLLLH